MSNTTEGLTKPMSTCADCGVRERAICQSLCDTDLDALNRIGRRQTIERGQTLQWQGDDSLLVGNVIDGVLKLSSTSTDGRDQTLGIMFASDFIGRPFGKVTDHSIVALTDAKICTFPRAAFDDFARDHPDLEHGLLQRTLTELDRTRQWMVLLGRKSATERVSAFLLEMADRLADNDNDAAPLRFALPFGRQEIGDLLGLTIETVSRQITRLREDGVIETPDRRSIVVLDRDALEACAG
ncbi:Crp/Fnr family transcriptional regulator [Novosphingobium sp. PS1R-30]|uniref:Crp/Fnr family transcriptional regulator n=2 Tax=Novosphingobium anseongense TaxID=3133436 RepID=A0ABU8RXC4_9SPHN